MKTLVLLTALSLVTLTLALRAEEPPACPLHAIVTSDAEAIAAVHEFLRAQIGDHRTEHE